MKLRQWLINAVVAALYIALTGILAPISFGLIQARVSEMLNHLGVYHKNYKWGVIAGVFISNLLFSPMVAYDLVFGVGQTLLSFLILDQIFKKVQSVPIRMSLTTIVFSLSMALIAWEIVLASGSDASFWPIYASTAISEFFILAITAPLMALLNRVVDFKKQMENA